MFPVTHKLNFYILFGINSFCKELIFLYNVPLVQFCAILFNLIYQVLQSKKRNNKINTIEINPFSFMKKAKATLVTGRGSI
jgi:hypothetical protein